ncbi:MAG: YgiQ family radical SAM protein [Campylobacterota bacterium]|nr:YgiQ family radical SAM protein [Campylobacterota bacterium]
MFIPTTKEELKKLNWDQLDIILVSGDTYIDSPYSGMAIIGKLLIDKGYKVGIIAQPDYESDRDITRLGEPKLFWGVSSGLVDSMVANYTALKKFRNSDDFTPDGQNNKRPDRAALVYSNLIRRYFKDTAPIVLGGIEASLRRVAHYDFWSNKVRGSILFDAKADYIIYGMGEKTVVELADALRDKNSREDIRGLCYISKTAKDDYIELPTLKECQNKNDKTKFIEMFHKFYENNDPLTSKGLCQEHNGRYLIQNPPQYYMQEKEIDQVYDLPYEREVHPYYAKEGHVKAMDTIRFSVTTHHGCYGECNFCAISVHQGRTIRSRSEKSILNEVKGFAQNSKFKGTISDVGGATANMYGYECDKKLEKGVCEDRRCTGFRMFNPNNRKKEWNDYKICNVLKPNHQRNIQLLKDIRAINGVKKVFVNSGIRYDLINEDKQYGKEYLKQIVTHHVSGQMKIAPEHSETKVLKFMGKPDKEVLKEFKANFEALNKQSGKKQFLTYYMIAAHPGSTQKDMEDLKEFANKDLKLNPQQIQIFTPTPSTYSTLMYYTEIDPWKMEKIFVEKDPIKKQKQKDIVTQKSFESTKNIKGKSGYNSENNRYNKNYKRNK